MLVDIYIKYDILLISKRILNNIKRQNCRKAVTQSYRV